MTDDPGTADPWAWAREKVVDEALDLSEFSVVAVVVTHNGERWVGPLLTSLAGQTLRPSIIAVDAGSTDGTPALLQDAIRSGAVSRVVTAPAGESFGASVAAALAGGVDADWVWLLHDDSSADQEALARLLTASVKERADIVGPVLLEPRRRRGRAARIAEAGQTITRTGVVTGVVAEGQLDQGQLDGGDVLGLNACGLLVRRSAWEALGGLDAELPSVVQGLEFCWRARTTGRRAVVEPTARLVHWQASQRGLRDGDGDDPDVARRRWGLALHEAFRPGPLGAGERASLSAASTRRVLGFVAGKDLLDARLERRAVREWRDDRSGVSRLHARYLEATQGAAEPEASEHLRLTAKTSRARRLDETFGRVVDWLSSFGDRGGGPGLDALTGDDFARDDQSRRRLSPSWIVTWVLVLGALAASRHLFVGGPLTASQLLPAPGTLGGVVAQYTQPIAGVDPSAGAPWLGLLAVVSLLTLGHPDLVVSLLLLGCVPLAFVLARRLLGRLTDDPWLSIGGAAFYALVPVLSGAVGSGQLGTVSWTLALPVLGHQVVRWWDDRQATWQLVGAAALSSLVMLTAEPSTWVLVVAALVVVGRRSGHWLHAAVAALAPLLSLVTPYTAELLRYPGRLLTGSEPLLAPDWTPTLLDVLLARTVPQAPAWWVGALTFGVVWLVAIAGAVARRGAAAWTLAGALACGAVAAALTHVVVTVPPAGEMVRPQGSAWIVAMAALLVCSAVTAVGGLRADILGSAFDIRHGLYYAAALLATVAVVAGASAWVVVGHQALQRQPASDIPAFIRKDAAKGASRILALHLDGDRVRWSLLEDDLGVLGDGERGLGMGGSSAAQQSAASLARRLAVGSADERIVPDLRALGIGYVWATGATAEQRAGITNSPGIGTGATDDKGTSWAVPGAGRIIAVDGFIRTKLEPGGQLPVGGAGRTILLAEPPSPVTRVLVDGVALAADPTADSAPVYVVPASGPGSSGLVTIERGGGFPVWAVLQGLLLLAVLVLAAPASPSAADAQAHAPRRAGRSS